MARAAWARPASAAVLQDLLSLASLPDEGPDHLQQRLVQEVDAASCDGTVQSDGGKDRAGRQ